MVTVSQPSLVPPKGTGEAPALSPPVRGFSTRALQARGCTHTSSKRGRKKIVPERKVRPGHYLTVRVTVVSVGLERPPCTKRLKHQMLAMPETRAMHEWSGLIAYRVLGCT